MRMVFLVLLLVFSMGCISPTTEHVCPDGSVVSQENQCPAYSADRINPENLGDISSIDLTENKHYYVAAEGKINSTILIKSGEDASVFISRFSTKDTQLYKFVSLSKEATARSVKLVPIGSGIYEFTVIAPSVPGEYEFSITKRNQSTQTILDAYNLTVMGDVENENIAYNIADAFMNSKIPDDFGFDLTYVYRTKKNWNIIKNESNETENSWEVFIEAQYDRCGIDENMDNCVRGNVVTGRYVIDKETGQIIG